MRVILYDHNTKGNVCFQSPSCAAGFKSRERPAKAALHASSLITPTGATQLGIKISQRKAARRENRRVPSTLVRAKDLEYF